MVTLKKSSINICVGESGDRLTRASKILEELTGQKTSVGHAQQTIRSFGVHGNEEISVFCSVRGLLANDLFERALRIKEYHGMKYDPNIGIFGMNFVVICGKNGTNNRVTKEEVILWFKNAFNGIVTNTENLYSPRNSSTTSTDFDPCTGGEISCTKHVSYPPEILKKIDQNDMTNRVEKYRRRLCIGQSIPISQWPKDINNLPGEYIKELPRIFEEKKDAIGYSIKLTITLITSKMNSEQTIDWYVFPDQIKLKNINIKQIENVVEKIFLHDQLIIKTKQTEKNLRENNHLPEFDQEIQCEKLNSLWILVCCHQQLDERCVRLNSFYPNLKQDND